MNQLEGQRRNAIVPRLLLATVLLGSPCAALALDPPLQIGQYAHTAWTVRDRHSLGGVFAMAQTPDGYLWLGGEFGLFRFDGLRVTDWRPPAGQELPGKPYSLLVSRDGTLWIGTFDGLASWNGVELTRYPEVDGGFVTSLLEDRDGTVWAGVLANPGRLCAVRGGRAQCHQPDGGFGLFVWSLAEDSAGVLWAGAESGLWRWKPGPPKRYEVPSRLADLITTQDGQLLIGIRGAGLKRLAGDKLESYPIRNAVNPAELIPDHVVKSNKLLRDRDGGLWVGTDGRGLIHVKDGKADAFGKADGLSGNISCSLFEDREGNIWFTSERGLDRFRKLPVVTISLQQGLSSDIASSVLATADGSVWVATNDGVTRWKDARPTVFRKESGLPDVVAQSLFQDLNGRVWVGTNAGLAYFERDRFVRVDGLSSKEVYSMDGDEAGTLWISGDAGLSRFQDGRFVETFPWAALGRRQQAKVVVPDDGGVWMSFWLDGGVLYFKDGKIRETYTTAQGLGKGHVSGLRRDRDGAIWAATEEGGLSRITKGRISTLTTRNGLPCNTIHWSMEDNDRSLWMYTACGLVRVMRDDLEAWIADPTRSVGTKLWGAAEGVTLKPVSPAYFNPPVAKAADGKLWFVSGVGIHVIDPGHLPFNTIPPPVYIEQVVADRKPHSVANGLRLPPLVRDINIEFTALSFADPENVNFRYRLEGHDKEWQQVAGRRQASYTNLSPGNYRFHVKASNNNGVWNEKGAQLEFSIAPAFYQTSWFRLAGVILFVGLVWGGFQLRLHMRIRRLQRQFEMTLDARVAERTRIARDLHDTLLQSFHGLLLQFQTACTLLPHRAAESKQVLVRAIDQAAAAISEGRDTVQGLRTSATDTNNLADSLRALAEDLANENGNAASAHIDVQGPPRDLHPIVRDESFRIACEALRNAFRHAGAKRIDVEIHYDARQFRVRVRDDGKGIDPEVLRSGEREGHFGLDGMRERAKFAGGKLTLWSGPDSGTEIELSTPGARAYRSPPPPRSWFAHKMFGQHEVGE